MILCELTNLLVQTVNRPTVTNLDASLGVPVAGRKIKLPKLRVALLLKEMVGNIVDVSTPMTPSPMKILSNTGDDTLSRSTQETYDINTQSSHFLII